MTSIGSGMTGAATGAGVTTGGVTFIGRRTGAITGAGVTWIGGVTWTGGITGAGVS